MEIASLAPMYRQYSHQQPQQQQHHHHHHHIPQPGSPIHHHSQGYGNQSPGIDNMSGRRSMAGQYEMGYPVYSGNHISYSMGGFQPSYTGYAPQEQAMMPSYPHHHSHRHGPAAPLSQAPLVPHHAMQTSSPIFPVPPLTHGMSGLRSGHESPLQQQHSPPIKQERNSSPRQPAMIRTSTTAESSEDGVKTDVDTLMKTIQAKSPESDSMSPVLHSSTGPQSTPFIGPVSPSSTHDNNGKARRKYQCTYADCGKFFFQKTHLEIHMRAHTGHKPFICRECGQRFSQLGNLKTHERRHTGERPYSCEQCGKRFAQRGNVRAHRVVHAQIKPYTCRLDNCGKHFTQLGNLKSHQNKFHAQTIQDLTNKFSFSHAIIDVSPTDRDLWQYFSELYKNSNKGIKGRGKDRRIQAANSPVSTRSGEGDLDGRYDGMKHQPSPHDHFDEGPQDGYSSGHSSSGCSDHE